MSSLAVVTTFPPNRWTAYAKRMIESHVKYWPDDVMLHAYYEGNKPDFNHAKVKFVGTGNVSQFLRIPFPHDLNGSRIVLFDPELELPIEN